MLNWLLSNEEIVIVRVKDRFVQAPSAGGWRDVMINFYFKSDRKKHICEIQLVHNQLLTARKGLSGHVIYNIVRNANELLDMNKREYPTQFRSKEDLFNSLNEWYILTNSDYFIANLPTFRCTFYWPK